jgi:hypothetical protein
MSDPEDERNSFVRGMTIGAILGAIIAGSSLWTRRRRRRQAEEQQADEPLPQSDPTDDDPEVD